MSPPPSRAPGYLALGCYLLHLSYYLYAGDGAWNILWICNTAVLLSATGWLTRRPAWNAAGFLWSCYGLPYWLLYLSQGGEFLVTSVGTHVGGLLIAAWGLRQLGLPERWVWWKAALGTVALLGFTRLVASPDENVNLAFGVDAAWRETFPNYPGYITLIVGGGSLLFLVVEAGLRALLKPSEPLAEVA